MIDEISFQAIAESYANSYERAFAPWSKISPEEWATEVYRLPSGARFTWEYAPYARAMFRSLFNRATIETCFKLYSRGLKSTVILLAMGYVIDQSPRRILSLWPTNSQAEKWSKDILCGELFNTTPCLNYLGNETGRRIASNTLLHKLFPGGLIDMFGANAPGDMRRAKGSWLYADEIDAIGTEMTDEGDQLAIFSKRGDEYPDTVRVFASYPSVKGQSRIDTKYKESDGNEWFSTCVKCGGEPFVMTRKMIVVEKDRAETARFTCPRCKELLNDHDRYSMAHLQGFDNWKAQRPFRGKRGFHANAMLWPHPVDELKYPGGWLQCLAQAEMDADASQDPKRALRVLVNTVDAEPFDPTDETEAVPDWEKLYKLREDYGDEMGNVIVPQPAILITAFVDIQNNRLEVEWKGWGRDEQSWGLAYTVLDGNPLEIQPGSVWHRLAKELQRTFTREDKAPMNLTMCFVDAGKWGDWAYAFYRLTREYPDLIGKVLLTKGVGKHGEPINCRRMAGIHRNIKGIPIGVWAAKDLVYARLHLERKDDGTFPGGYMHHPLSYNENHFQQLTSDKVSIRFENGQEVRAYGNNEGKRDEALDTAVGNLAVFKLRNWNFDAMEEELKSRIPVEAGQTQPAPVSNELGTQVVEAGGWS